MGDAFEDISFQENGQDGQVGKQWTVLVTGYGVSQLACVFRSSCLVGIWPQGQPLPVP